MLKNLNEDSKERVLVILTVTIGLVMFLLILTTGTVIEAVLTAPYNCEPKVAEVIE